MGERLKSRGERRDEIGKFLKFASAAASGSSSLCIMIHGDVLRFEYVIINLEKGLNRLIYYF